MRSLFRTVLLLAFSFVALTLAAVGISGVVSFSVSQRTREIGIRIALGATKGAIISLILNRSMRAVAIGIVFGLLGSFALTRFLTSLLFEVKPMDPIVLGIVTALLVIVAGAAGYLSKGAAPQDVVNAIRSVQAGQRYIASDIAQQMALSQLEPQTETPFSCLSERELQIMLMITKGKKVNEISEQLNLSPKTVNSYRYRMFSKLNISGDVELTHLAIRHGLFNAETLLSSE